MLTYNNTLYKDYNNFLIANLKHFQASLRGRMIVGTLFSINRTTDQSEHGKIKSQSGHMYTKVMNIPFFNVQTSEKNVTFDFDNGGYRATDGISTTATVLSDIYQIENEDLIVFNEMDQNTIYMVQKDENDLYESPNNNGNIKTINLRSTDKDKEELIANTNLTLYYQFERNNLIEYNLREKLLTHFNTNIDKAWKSPFILNFDRSGYGKGFGNKFDKPFSEMVTNSVEIFLPTYIESLPHIELHLQDGFEDYDLESTSLSRINEIHNNIDFESPEHIESFLFYLKKFQPYFDIKINPYSYFIELEG